MNTIVTNTGSLPNELSSFWMYKVWGHNVLNGVKR